MAVVVVVLGAAALLWWRTSSRKPRYVTATVTRGNIQRSVAMTGALNPVVTVQVGSYVSGTLKTLMCDFNTEVVVGQICARIDPVPFQLIVDQDKAQVGTAAAQMKKDQAALVYAKIAFERDSKLVAEGTVSQDTVDSEKSAYDQTVAQIGLDQAAIVDKQAALKAAEVNLAYTNIVSPVIGTVITRSIDVGQTVAASLASPTLFIIGKDLTHMQVDSNVSEADVGGVRIGQGAFFTVQAFPGKTFHGKVTQIRMGPITVQNVVTYDVVIAVENPDRALFPGMTADTHIVTDEHDAVLRVPLPAVRFNPEGLAGLAASSSRTPTAGSQAGAGAGTPGGPEATPESANAGEERRGRRGEGRPEGRGEGGRPGREGGEGGHGSREGRPGRGEGHRSDRSQRGSRESKVWVLNDDGSLRPVTVTTGLDDGALVEVTGGGLKPGDKVVVNAITPGSTETRRSTPGAGQGFGQGFGPGQGQGQGQAFRPPGPRS